MTVRDQKVGARRVLDFVVRADAMLAQLCMQTKSNIAARFKFEVAMLFAALLAIVALRLVLPVVGFSQMMPREMRTGTAMTSTPRDIGDSAMLMDSQTATEQHCKDTMPGCDTFLQGVCLFSSAFVVSSCADFISPVAIHSLPPPISADDLSPLGQVPRIPPRP